ncbi:MAG: hypothetical protein ACRDYB_03870 [Acidimicrobiales bacterium]
MPMAASTKDCTSLSDTELVEMADLSAEREVSFDIGFVSKQREEWVLVTQVREGNKLRGYSFCTLERIGGTPSLLVGLATTDRTTKAESALRAMMADQYRRALLAFPDEDVLLGTRLLSVDGFKAFAKLTDVVPRLDHRPSGEERAWARRLAKRFGAENRLDDRTFVTKGTGTLVGGLDFESQKSQPVPELEALFKPVNVGRGDRLVAFGWAMAEDLAAGRLGR